MHTVFLVLSLLAFVVALVIGVSSRRSKFFGYQGMAKEVERLTRALQAETFRDRDDLVIRGNHANLPVLVRFSYNTDSSGLSITMQAPATFHMSVTPASAAEREQGTRVRTEDGLFDFKFIINSRQHTLARMFVSSAGTLRLMKKLCWSSSTSLRIDSGQIEFVERPFDVAQVFDYVENYLATMQSLAEKLRAMPGADAIRIVPFRKSGSPALKPAIALGLSLALLQASRISGAGTAQRVSMVTEAAVQEGMLPADVARTMFLPGWHLAQESDFDSDAASWLRAQGATPSATVHADFSGKDNSRDVAYILVNDRGVMTLVVFSEGQLVYNQQYDRILTVARVRVSNFAGVQWRDPLPGKPDGDGLLVVTNSASVILTLSNGNVISGSPADYRKVPI